MNFTCDGCGQSSHAVQRAGWAKLPFGWLVQRGAGIESFAVVACSDGCVERIEEHGPRSVGDRDSNLDADRAIRDAEAHGDLQEVDRLLQVKEQRARAKLAERNGTT